MAEAAPPLWPIDPVTSEAAVAVLQAELSLVAGNLDSLDNKAGLLLPFLGVITGLTLPATLTQVQAVLVGLALASGAISVYFVFRVLLPQDNHIGPTAQEVAAAVGVDPGAFRAGVVFALAKSIDLGASRSKDKGRNLKRATGFASLSILLLIVVRLVGAIP